MGSAASAGVATQVAADHIEAVEGTVGALSFYSAASQIAADGESELEDDDVALVRAEPTAFNFETTPPEPIVYEDSAIPLVSQDTDDPVVGIGTTDFVNDDNGGFAQNNEQFLVNLFDDLIGPDSVVAWDESHAQFWSLDRYDTFAEYADHEGYDLRASQNLLGSGELTFNSTASQVGDDGESPLTDPKHVVVWAESSAYNVDSEDDGAVIYEEENIPLVSRDGKVIGFGTPELIDDDGITENNTQFVSNLLADTIGGSGTVVWDDAHDTFWSSEQFSAFEAAIGEEGYSFVSSGDSLREGEQPSVIIADPAIPHATSVHTWELEDIAFGDPGNDGDEVDSITVAYENASFDGLTNDDITVTMTRTLSDGEDTSEITVNSGTYSGSKATFDLSGWFQTDVAGPVIVEIEGIENPPESESASITLEGDADPVTVEDTLQISAEEAESVDELEFFSTASLLAPDGEPLTDEEVVAVWAESTATNENASVTATSDYLTTAPATPGAEAAHTWEFDDVDIDGEVDEITVEYPTGTSFDGLTDEDITVVLTRELADGPDQREISVNSGSYNGSSATFDLSGAFTTNIVGESWVEIDGLKNPSPGDHSATITFTAEEDAESVSDTLVIESLIYPDDVDIPLVAIDGGIVGIGAELAPDESDVDDNRKFVANLWENRLDGTGTVLYDETHGQGLSLDEYSELRKLAEDRGFTVDRITDDFVAALDDADGVMITSEDDDIADHSGFTDDELDALGAFLEDGGAVFLHDNADFGGDSTAQLNEIVASLNADFRFNADQVVDDEHSGFAPFVPQTSNFNENFDLFVVMPEEISGEPVEELEFFSTASVLNGGEEPLTDVSRIAVWAEETAFTNSEEYRNDGDPVGDGPDIPLVGVDGGVVAIGSELGPDASGEDDNRTFLVNAWADRIGSAGVVKYDETHGQGLSLDGFSQLQATAEDRGFSIEAITGEFEAALDDADAVMIASDDDDLEAFSGSELDALADFVDDGGALFLHDTADFGGDSTDVLNEVLDAVDADLRFNSDQVEDPENHGFAPFVPRTSNFNDAEYPGFFGPEETELTGTIDAADVVAIASPATAYADAELDALQAHVDDGGAIFLFDESEFVNEETDNLNAIADHLSLDFRFNPDQVEDEVHNDGLRFFPTTTSFNEGFDVFDGLLELGLPDVEGVVITTPAAPFSEPELQALQEFVAAGGAVFLFDQADFGGHDETESMNEIADALDLDFRFNADQVNDAVHNVGPEFDILTANYDVDPDDPGIFAEREVGVGITFDRGEEYFGKVVRVFDGDTFEVEFDERHNPFGVRDVIRHIGIDTAETPPAQNEPEEWFGIPDHEDEHLYEWGANATDFSLELMAPEGAEAGEPDIEGRRVRMTFDEKEPLRGNFGRLLMYMYYDPHDFDADPDEGNFAVNYNYETVEEGYARIYSSGFSKHDDWAVDEEAALADGRGIWAAADFEHQAANPIRNHDVDDLYFPPARTIRTKLGRNDGRLNPHHDDVPVFASATAEQVPSEDAVEYDEELPLVAFDDSQRIALVGAVMIHEEYDSAEDDFDDDTTEFGNFPFLTNLIDHLADSDGHVLIVGGQGQFNIPGSIPLERCQYYLRYVEGIGSRMRQINDVENTLPREVEEGPPRAVIITAPDREFTQREIIELRKYREEGGSIILMASGDNEPQHVENLNELAHRLNTYLRFNNDEVVDEENHLEDDPRIVVTEELNEEFDLFGAYKSKSTKAATERRTWPRYHGKAIGD